MHCISDRMTAGNLWIQKNVIDESPPYQRESGVWGQAKKQLFIDSILNNYDVPKIYMHDLRTNSTTSKNYAVIDGKQRLDAIWTFISDGFVLADDFKISDDQGFAPPQPGQKFTQFSPEWQEIFKGKTLDIVLVENADEEDIEDLFSRLNNGEPLTAAEKRNAMGGDMCALIREIADHDFFKQKLKVSNARYQHYEVAAKLLIMEKSEIDHSSLYSDLKKRFLDKMVTDNRQMTTASRKKLTNRVAANLKKQMRVFDDQDSLLSKQAYPPMYYAFLKEIQGNYGHSKLNSKVKEFLKSFNKKRLENLELEEDDRDVNLIEFGRLIMQGTNDLNSVKNRVSILRRYFLQDNGDVKFLDAQRGFTDEEREAIYYRAGRKCEACGIELASVNDMHADHKKQWSYGGETTLENGRCLCVSCNTSAAAPVG